MRAWLISVVAVGALFTGVLASSLAAQARVVGAVSSPPTLITSDFVCSNSVCAVGPGNTGMAFAAGLVGTGGPIYYGPECNPYVMTVAAGTLPPGLQLGEPICEWEIFGTPSARGTYTFTVRIAPQPNNLGQTVGPDGFQQLSITIGTGTSDRLLLTGAVWTRKFATLQITGFDVNNGVTYTVYVTSTGAKVGTITEKAPNNGGDGTVFANFSMRTPPATVTVTDTVGGSATIPVIIHNGY